MTFELNEKYVHSMPSKMHQMYTISHNKFWYVIGGHELHTHNNCATETTHAWLMDQNNHYSDICILFQSELARF